MFPITESNHAQLEQFPFIQSALLTYKMLTHKGECLQQREQILQKKKSQMHVFPLLRAKRICIRSATKNLKIYRITTVLIKMNVLSNLSDSEFSLDMAL